MTKEEAKRLAYSFAYSRLANSYENEFLYEVEAELSEKDLLKIIKEWEDLLCFLADKGDIK